VVRFWAWTNAERANFGNAHFVGHLFQIAILVEENVRARISAAQLFIITPLQLPVKFNFYGQLINSRNISYFETNNNQFAFRNNSKLINGIV